MKKGLVSVVVPVYNVEQYLDRCIESVVNQTYHNLEIILVDDGSPDNCPRKCDEWADEDSRIKVIHKKNEGLGMARNTGIENAIGEYICFFDSDDYVALDAIEKAYQCISAYHADIVHFGSFSIGSDGKEKDCRIPQTEKMLYQGDEVQNYILPNLMGANPRTGKSSNLWITAWTCMYSMRVIQKTNWRFVSERQYNSEDSYSHLILYKDITRVAVLPEALYYHCENAMSLSLAYRKDRYERIKFWYEECLKVCNIIGYEERVRESLTAFFFDETISALRIIACEDYDKREKKAEIDMILKDCRLYEAISSMDIKTKNRRKKAIFIAVKYRLYWLGRWMVMAKAQEFKMMRRLK